MSTLYRYSIVLFILSVVTQGQAYCRTTTCAEKKDEHGEVKPECVPGSMVGNCQMAGNPLFWPKSCMSTSVQIDGSNKLGISADEVEAIVRTCFDNWENLTCPQGGKPNVHVESFPQVECNEKGYNSKERNQNVWVFRDDVWPNKDADSTIALTTVQYWSDGTIVGADVEFNSAHVEFQLDTIGGNTDLFSVIQHESGHFLGLAHSDSVGATMWPSYDGQTSMRTLEADDAAGICAVFPPTDKPDLGCDPTPRHGFSTLCHESVKDDGCSIQAPDVGVHKHSSALFLIAFAASGFIARRTVGKSFARLNDQKSTVGFRPNSRSE
jgi:Matrixin